MQYHLSTSFPKFFLLFLLTIGSFPFVASAKYRFDDFRALPPIHEAKKQSMLTNTITPESVKNAYGLPESGGKGTIAIIAAYDSPDILKDLNVFSKKFKLPQCESKGSCFEKKSFAVDSNANSGWAMETALDVEWAHAIAPDATILLVEAKTPSGANLLKAVDYARNRPDVVAISMSWGGKEFSDETTLDEHFISKYGATFFAASGDNGTGASWPAASPNVISVGGTHLTWDSNGKVVETAWTGSGGGVSMFESAPSYQSTYDIPHANGMRAIPDVAYNADPSSGFPIYANEEWHVVGGTSAGTPQWAAIRALGNSMSGDILYKDKSNDASKYFRDITSGKNGSCTYYCNARKHYDFVTGLGSPLTSEF